MVRVLVVAAGVVQGDARLVLQGVALGGLGLAGVDLEGQGLLGCDELEEEGQPAPEAPDDVLPQEALRLGVDELGQHAALGDLGGPGRVGSVPGLGPGGAVVGPVQEGGDGGGGPPGVPLARRLKSSHGASPYRCAGTS